MISLRRSTLVLAPFFLTTSPASPAQAAPPATQVVPPAAERAADPAAERAADVEAWRPRRPSAPVRDLAVCEAAHGAIRARLRSTLLAGLQEGDREKLAAALTTDAAGRFPLAAEAPLAPGSEDSAAETGPGRIELRDLGAAAPAPAARDGLVAALAAAVAGAERVERAEWEAFELLLEPGGARAFAAADLVLTGTLAPLDGGDAETVSEPAPGGRFELRATLETELARAEGGAWCIARLVLAEGHLARRRGPLFRDVTAAVGLDLAIAPANRALHAELVDARQVATLGGVSVLDWDGDGFDDVLVTRREQLTALFLNDGRGGFVPAPLPVEVPADSGYAWIFLDLDGDGREELVGGRVEHGREAAQLGLWSRNQDGAWRRLDRSLAFALAPGARDPQVLAIVPADVDGDGLLDLYCAVHSESGTEDAAAGGADRLFVNRGGLAFHEEAAERGLFGRRRTHAACFLDVDGDGDPDLVEGCDGGATRLWTNDGRGRFALAADHAITRAGATARALATTDLGDGRLGLWLAGTRSPAGLRLARIAPGLDGAARARVAASAAGSRLLERAEGGAWHERAAERGVAATAHAWAGVFLDVDDDGDRDLWVATGGTSHSDPEAPDWEPFHWRGRLAEAGAGASGPYGAGASGQDGPGVEPGPPPLDPELVRDFRGSAFGRQRDRLLLRAGDATGPRFFDAAALFGLDRADDSRSAVAFDPDGDGDLDLLVAGLDGLRLLLNPGTGRAFARVRVEATRGEPYALGATVTVEAGGRRESRLVALTSGAHSQVPRALHFGLGGAERVERVTVRWPSGEEESWSDLPVRALLVLRERESEARVEPVPAWPAEALPPADAAPSLAVEAAPLPSADGPARGAPADAGDSSSELADAERAPLADRGAPTVVHVWAPEDAASAADVAVHAALARERAVAEGAATAARFVGVCVAEDAAAAAGAARALELPHPQRLADRALLDAFFGAHGAVVVPATFVFDATGALHRVFRRPVAAAELRATLDVLGDEGFWARDLLRHGALELARGDLPRALGAYRAALRADPELADAYLEVGKIFVLVGEPAQAERFFEKAVDLDPTLDQAWFNLGVARTELGRFEAAVAPIEAALDARGEDPETLVTLGLVLRHLRELPRALEVLERATAAGPSARAWTLKARVLAELGRPAEARAALRRAQELDPTFEDAARALRELDGR